MLTFAEFAEAEEADHDAIKRTLGKTREARQDRDKSDFLAATEADFFQTLIERKGESTQELNVLCCQLCQPRSTQR